jgi:hypothetical protein
MNLLDIRKQVVALSGHYELVVDTVDYEDNGVDNFIYQGQRMLDRKIDFTFSEGSYFVDLTIGQFTLPLSDCRVIEEVWIMDENGRKRVEFVDQSTLRGKDIPFAREWFVKPFSKMEKGLPQYFYPSSLRRAPDNGVTTGDSATLKSYLAIKNPTTSFNGIVFVPPADKTYSIEVIGMWYTPKLVENDDENYWTVNYSNLLVMGALHQISSLYGGAESADNWDKKIDNELQDLEKDHVYTDNWYIDSMEG